MEPVVPVPVVVVVVQIEIGQSEIRQIEIRQIKIGLVEDSEISERAHPPSMREVRMRAAMRCMVQ